MISALILAASAFSGTQSPAASAPPCSGPEYRQLDFWVGDWTLDYDPGDGTKGTATNRITKDEYGRCVIIERFAMPNGYKGTSYSIYDRETKGWRQMWVDNGGGNFTLVGGPATGKDYAFALNTFQPTGKDKRLRRMIWQDVRSDSLVWRWQSLQPDGSWKDDWVLNYRRKPR